MRFVFTCHGLICEIWMQHKKWIFNYCSTHVHGSKCRKYTAKFGFCTLQCSILITYPCKVATAAILIQTRCVQSVFSLKKITVGSSDCHTAQYKNPMQQCTILIQGSPAARLYTKLSSWSTFEQASLVWSFCTLHMIFVLFLFWE